MSKDPVCGMEIAADGPRLRVEHRGETYDFCSADCKSVFLGKPEAYVRGEGVETPAPLGEAQRK